MEPFLRPTAPSFARCFRYPLCIRYCIHTKATWILRHQDFFLSFHPLTPSRKYVSGGTHVFLGKQYRLKLKEDNTESVKLSAGWIKISLKDKTQQGAYQTFASVLESF